MRKAVSLLLACFFYIILFIFSFIRLFLAVLGRHCCMGFFPVAGQSYFIAVASLVAELGSRACGLSSYCSRALEHRLNSCGARA